MEDKKVQRTYSNQVIMDMGMYDFNFKFFSSCPGKDLTDEDLVAEIIMSPQHTKVFAITISNYVRDYEKIFGEINLEPNQDAITEIKNQNQG